MPTETAPAELVRSAQRRIAPGAQRELAAIDGALRVFALQVVDDSFGTSRGTTPRRRRTGTTSWASPRSTGCVDQALREEQP
jgi:hypothetical protein